MRLRSKKGWQEWIGRGKVQGTSRETEKGSVFAEVEKKSRRNNQKVYVIKIKANIQTKEKWKRDEVGIPEEEEA